LYFDDKWEVIKMTSIHMETESVYRLTNEFKQKFIIYGENLQSLRSITSTIDWHGPSKDVFVSEVNTFISTFSSLIDDAENLGLRLQQEVDQWVSIDNQISPEMASVAGTIAGIGNIIVSSFKGFSRTFIEVEFNNWWKKRSKDEKIKYLNDELARISESLGIEIIPLEIEELDDTKGDYGGYYSPERGVMVLDLTNLENDKPWDLINIVAHELRHRYQHVAVEHYSETGQLLDGVSKSQVETWRENFDNYIEASEDFESYRKQPLEVDAREYGSEYEERCVLERQWRG